MNSRAVTETRIGNVTYIVTSECSPTATETVEQKLERLIMRHVLDKESYQLRRATPLDISRSKSDHVSCGVGNPQ